MDIERMQQNLADVFNTYNLNILFTIASLPAKVSLMAMPNMGELPQGQVKTKKVADFESDSDDDYQDEKPGKPANKGNDAQMSMKNRHRAGTG